MKAYDRWANVGMMAGLLYGPLFMMSHNKIASTPLTQNGVDLTFLLNCGIFATKSAGYGLVIRPYLHEK